MSRKSPWFPAVLLHDNFAAVFKDRGINQLRAVGAERLGAPR